MYEFHQSRQLRLIIPANLARPGPLPHERDARAHIYFKVNNALTCAVTETDLGRELLRRRRCGIGHVHFIMAPAMGATRTFSNVSTEA